MYTVELTMRAFVEVEATDAQHATRLARSALYRELEPVMFGGGEVKDFQEVGADDVVVREA